MTLKPETIADKIKAVPEKIKAVPEKINEFPWNDVLALVKEAPRHGYITYVNRLSLSEEFFANAKKSSKDDQFVYLVLSNTGSHASNVLERAMNKKYNHSSLSFDSEFNTLVSYNNGNGRNSPGMNQEFLEDLYQKPEADYAVYKMRIGTAAKLKMLKEIARINQEGSAYNVIGAIFKVSVRHNIMFCSEFVYRLFEIAGCKYFEKNPLEVIPMDFVENDAQDELIFCEERKLAEVFGEKTS